MSAARLSLLDHVVGAWELLKLGVRTRFRLRGKYWEWRLHTAFGRGYPGRGEMVRAMLEYGCWMRRMRRL
ncbi:MAG: hypothetical protein WAZ94_10525 [Phycisphaerales bacterium]|nr:hypothetical protein [Phycisphaerales bacterium]